MKAWIHPAFNDSRLRGHINFKKNKITTGTDKSFIITTVILSIELSILLSLSLQLLDGVGAQSRCVLWARGLHRPGDLHLLPVHLHPAAQTPREEVRAQSHERGAAEAG